MTINTAQIEYIKNCIDHLLSFSEDENALLKELEDLKQALEHPVEQTHPFFDLRLCFTEPTSMLLGLERYDDAANPAFIGEAQIAILQLIQRAIAQVSNDHTAKSIEEYFAESITQSIPENNFKLPFISKPPKQDNVVMAWEVLVNAQHVYAASLKLSDDKEHVLLKFNITYPNGMRSYNVLKVNDADVYHALYHSDIGEDDVLNAAISDGKRLAKKQATICLLNYLKNAKIITETELKGIKRNKAVWDLLTHRFYQNLLLTKKIPFEYLLYLDRNYVKILLNPTAISLLEESIYKIEEVLVLTETQLTIATLYKSLFQKDKEYYYRDFLVKISDSQAKLLSFPPMQNLILKKNRLNISTAVNLPPQINDLLAVNYFAEYVCNKPVPWYTFNKLKQSHFSFLQNPTAAILFANDVLDLKLVAELPDSLLQVLTNEKIATLLSKQVITIDEVYDLSLRTIELIVNEYCIYELLLNQIIHANDLHGTNTKKFYATVFSERIFGLLLDRPYTLVGVEDSFSIIKGEIESTCALNDMHYFVLYEWICKSLLEKIMAYCREHSIKSIHDTIKNTFHKVCGIINDRNKTNELATKTIEKIKNFLNAFDPSSLLNTTDETLQKLDILSKRLGVLDELLEKNLEQEQTNTPRLR